MTAPPPLDLAKLQRRLGGQALASLRERMRAYFERGAEHADSRSLTLSRLTPAEYEAVALLLGLRSRATKSLRIDVGTLDVALRHAGIAQGLREALEALDGPIVNQAAVRTAATARWTAVQRTAGRPAALAAWLQTATAGATLKRVSRRNPEAAEQLLEQVEVVLGHLPARGLTRAQLAAQALGRAHALDGGEPVATLLLAVLRQAAREQLPEPDAQQMDADPAQDLQKPAERARDIWALSGVLINELARPALHLNLSATPSLGVPGEPGYLSLRRLLRSEIAWSVAGRTVFVCENPNIVAIAADHWGVACAPLVCTEGMPAAAQRVLLTQLACAGASLRYHGDFDWPGIHIANHVIQSFGAAPWRMAAADYREALPSMPDKPRDLSESAVTAVWDDELATEMRNHGLAVDEEAVASSLMPDLASEVP